MTPSPIEIQNLGKRFRRRRSLMQVLPGGPAKPRETWALRGISL